MSVVCSRCTNIFEPVGSCPRCGADAPAAAAELPAPTHGPKWQQTAWGRILIGLILSQGLFYGLRHLLTGVLLAIHGGTAQELWDDVQNLILLQSIQVIGLLAGGLLAGGGQRNGFIFGAVVGAWNGVLAVFFRQNPAQGLTLVGLYGQPLLHAAFAALGGWIGSIIWKPIAVAAVPSVLAPPRKVEKAPKRSMFAGDVYWFRVIAGAAFAVAGTLSATILFQKVMEVSGGGAAMRNVLQDRLITWEIKALAVLVGGALAGATTPNGIKQGLYVGILASIVLVGIQAPLTETWVPIAGTIMASTFTLAMVGGWFGGQLLPPVMKVSRNRDFGMPSW